ncbi:MAG: hypothetical protein ACI802_000464 [Candidatus Paceibacteria bacterium]|jgi:hypothetical protein
MKQILWNKKGLIHHVDGQFSWAKSHAQVPTVDVVDKDRLRIYFSSRDEKNRSRIGSVDVSSEQPEKILTTRSTPVLDLGRIGTFDDCGVMPSWLINHGDRKYMYYIGWNVRNTVPYHNAIGLAVSDDEGAHFHRLFEGPIMDRSAEEPFFCATSCVLIDNGIWRNWYLSCTGWVDTGATPEPRYHLKYAESTDGIHWERKGIIAIDYADSEEGGIVRASVVKDGSQYRMWFSYRKTLHYREDPSCSYRIGYAESIDGIVWNRMDDLGGIAASEEGWDSFMVAYPQVIHVNDRLVMFYNGNDFGRSGFGYATADINS